MPSVAPAGLGYPAAPAEIYWAQANVGGSLGLRLRQRGFREQRPGEASTLGYNIGGRHPMCNKPQHNLEVLAPPSKRPEAALLNVQVGWSGAAIRPQKCFRLSEDTAVSDPENG